MNREIGTRSSQPLQSASRCMARLQRKCDCGNHMIGGGKCADCNTQERRLQRAGCVLMARRLERKCRPLFMTSCVLRGSPSTPPPAHSMDRRLGHDFSQVRVRTDAKAAESAQAVNALAYTVGRDVVFGAAQYAPTINERKKAARTRIDARGAAGRYGVDPQEKLTLGAVDNRFEQQAGEAEQITSTDSSPRAPTQA